MSAASKAAKPVWSYMRTNCNVNQPWRQDPRWANKLADVETGILLEKPPIGTHIRTVVFPVTFIASYAAYVACYNEASKKFFKDQYAFTMQGVNAVPVQIPTHYGLPVVSEKALKMTLNVATGRPAEEPKPVEEEEEPKKKKWFFF